MFKKILLTSLLASAVGVTFANPAPYVGAGIGINTNTTSTAPQVINGMTVGVPANFRGVPFNVFVGYGGVITQSFYLAGELAATVGTAEISNNGLKTTYGYSASILPGVMLSDHTLTFARVAGVRTRFSGSNTQTGLQLGLGMQTTLTQNIDLRGEYDYTSYRSFSSGGSSVGTPRTDGVNLALVYKFD